MSSSLNRAFGRSETRMQRFGRNAQRAGRDMMTGAVAMGAPLAYSLNQAIDYETQFIRVSKTVKGTDEEIKNLSTDIRSMAKNDIPKSTDELTAIAAAAGQLGIETPKIVKFTEVIAKLSDTTNLGDDAADSFAKFANITSMSQDNFDRLGSTVVALGNNFATTEADVVAFSMRIAGAATQVNISQAKIMGLATGLSSVGLEAEAGGTAISKTLIAMSQAVENGGADLQKFANVSGMSAAQFKKAFKDDAANATVSFIEGLGRMKSEGKNVFGVLDDLDMSEVRLRDTLMRASGASKEMRRALVMSSAAWEENTALNVEAATKYNSTASRIQFAKNKIADMGITIGQILIPAAEKMVGTFSKMADWLADLSERYPTLTKTVIYLVGGLVGLLSVAGAIAFTFGTVTQAITAVTTVMTILTARSTYATIVKWAQVAAENAWTIAQIAATVASVALGGGVMALWAGLKALTNTTKLATAAQWLLNLAMDANPIGLIVLGVAAAVAAVTAMVIYWEDLTAAFNDSHPVIKATALILAAPILPLVAIAGAIRWLIDNWDDLPGAAGKAIGGMFDYVKGIVPEFAKTVAKAIGFVATLPIMMPYYIFQAIKAMTGALYSAAPEFWDGAKGIFDKIVDFVSELPSKMFQAGKNIVNSMWEGMKSVAMLPINGIMSITDTIRDYLPFSPAKRGALMDIHKIKLVETIADTIKPAPMVSAMDSAMQATRASIGGAGLGSGGAAMSTGGGGSTTTINFAPVITVSGGSGGAAVAQSIKDELLKLMPDVLKTLERRGIRASLG